MGQDTKHKKFRYKINTLDKCLRLLVEAIKRDIKKMTQMVRDPSGSCRWDMTLSIRSCGIR